MKIVHAFVRVLRPIAPAAYLFAGLALLATSCAQKPPEEVFDQARQAARRGDTIGAILKCQKIIEKHPESPVANDARMLIAEANMRNGETDAARNMLREVIDQSGLQTAVGRRAFRGLVATHNMAKDVEGAIRLLEETQPRLENMPDFRNETRATLASLYRENKQPEKGRAILEEMRQEAKTEGEYLMATERLVATTMSDNKPGDAVRLYDDFLEKYPDSENKALVYFGQGFFYNRMADQAEDAEEKKKYEEKAMDVLGRSLEMLEKQLDAELVPQRKVAILDQVAKVQVEMKQSMKAIAALREFVQDNPTLQERAMLMGRIAEIQMMEGDFEAARKTFQEVKTSFPDSPIAQQADQILRAIDQKMEADRQARLQKDQGQAPQTPGETPAPETPKTDR